MGCLPHKPLVRSWAARLCTVRYGVAAIHAMASRPSTHCQALVRDNKREYGRILLELWVNQVLDNQSTGGTNSLGATAAVQGA